MKAEIEIDIPFHDVDSMNVAWHGHYLKYFEIARCALLDQFDYNYNQMKASGYAWPVIDVNVRYIYGLEFGQKVRVIATLKEWENRLKIDYQIVDSQTGKRLTKGSTTQVAVRIQDRELCLVSPPILLEKLKQWSAFQGELV